MAISDVELGRVRMQSLEPCARPRIHNDGGTGTAITNNTVRNNCADGIRVDGPSSAVSVENKVSTHNGDHTSLACGEYPTGVEIGIYGTATADALVDYNIAQIGSYHGDEREYAWNTR